MGFIDSLGNYYEGDRQGNDQIVPDKPFPRDEYFWDASSGWVHDVDLPKRNLGAIPTDVFIATVFEAPSGAPADYTWNRENVIRMVSPASSERMKKGQNLHGTRAELLQMAGWMLTYAVVPNTYPPQFTALEPNQDGTFTGGIISQEEYNKVVYLLDLYGVQ